MVQLVLRVSRVALEHQVSLDNLVKLVKQVTEDHRVQLVPLEKLEGLEILAIQDPLVRLDHREQLVILDFLEALEQLVPRALKGSQVHLAIKDLKETLDQGVILGLMVTLVSQEVLDL